MPTPTLTIKIAGRGTRLDNGETSKAGHMWYSVSDGFGNSSSYGFPPIIDNNPLNDALGPGDVNAHGSDDEFYKEIPYSTTKDITQHQYELLNRFGTNPSEFGFSQLYDGLDNSCVDFTWKALEIAGLNPSGHQGSFWPTHNRDDLRRFVDLSPIEIARLNRLLKNQFPNSWPDPFDDDFWTNRNRNWNRAKARPSPLTLDLDGDGVETTALSAGLYFHHNADGFAEATGWAGKDDGLLVRDLNGNGRIDSGRELFGNQTLRTSGPTATNGFEALKDLDSNADGQITSTDTAWASLRVWKDANTNGQTDAGELLSLTQAGVQRIQLAYSERDAAVAPDTQGNQHRQTGTYITTSGTTRSPNDVWFDVERWDTQDQRTPVAVSSAIAALPNLRPHAAHGFRRRVATCRAAWGKLSQPHFRVQSIDVALGA